MRRVVHVIMAAALCAAVAVIPAQAAASRTWVVLNGGSVKDSSVVSNSFRPRTIDIAVGDTVTWRFLAPWTIHTVTFLSGVQPPQPVVQEGGKTYHNPEIFFPVGGKTYDGTGVANSGVPPDPTKAFSYSLTFTKAGTFNYLCLLHGPGMGGTVVVKARAAGSPSSVRSRGQREFAATLRAGQKAWAGWKAERRGKTLVLPMIGNTRGGWSSLRFSRGTVTIKRGTTVTWVVRDPLEIHTVTFTGGEKPPDFVVVEAQAQGPPKLLMPAKAAAPTPVKTYAGKGYVNSGILFPPGMPGNPPTSFSLTFNTPGRYEYICVIHLPWGMKGTIVVR